LEVVLKLLTKDTDYAVRAIVNLARNPEGYRSSRMIAVDEGIPLQFLRRILQKLTAAEDLDGNALPDVIAVIGPTGEQLGIKPIPQALSMAREMELDLVEVADKANPPVCRIMDYGKYKYEQSKKARKARQQSHTQKVKTIKFRPGDQV